MQYTLPTEPVLETPPHLRAVLEELKRREPIFHKPEFGSSRAQFEAMMDDEFWEVGASGKRYSREFVLEVLQKRARDPEQGKWMSSDFHCREIAPHNYLVTYTLQQGERLTRRATYWRRTPLGWKILFHQGTTVERNA